MRAPTTSERTRAQYLFELLASVDDRAIRRNLGIKDKGFKKRLMTNLQRYCSIADAPRSGRPRSYTTATHEASKDVLLELEDTVCSSKEFVKELQDRAILPPTAKHESFMRAFKVYLSGTGLTLAYGQRKLTFALSSRHVAARLAWCLKKGVTLTIDTVKTYWFGDEITISYGGKPKGGLVKLHYTPALPRLPHWEEDWYCCCMQYNSTLYMCIAHAVQPAVQLQGGGWGCIKHCVCASPHTHDASTTAGKKALHHEAMHHLHCQPMQRMVGAWPTGTSEA